MSRKFYSLEPGEEFIGVLRPSLWTLTPRVLASMMFIIFPFIFWPSLLHFGFILAGIMGAGIFSIGLFSLRDLRRHYLENGVSITSLRAIDVYAKRKNFKNTEIKWLNVQSVVTEKNGLMGLIGYGSLWIKGGEDVGYSIVIRPLWKPDLVQKALPKV